MKVITNKRSYERELKNLQALMGCQRVVQVVDWHSDYKCFHYVVMGCCGLPLTALMGHINNVEDLLLKAAFRGR